MRNIGIIGIGPRGGYSLERLIIELEAQNCLTNIHISLFEATGNFGNGQVYNLDQNDSNWINIAERVLKLHERKEIKSLNIKSFPSYHQWINKNFNKLTQKQIDNYPPRSKLGKFLLERFQSLIKPLVNANVVSLHKEQVTQINLLNNRKLQIFTNKNTYKSFDEILLTIGHQITEPSKQILKWDEYAANHKNIQLFKSPYPIANYLNHTNLNFNSSIGIRGFGLAMIDIVRAVAEKYGKFYITNNNNKLCSYKSEYKLKDMFIPFSLDGLPPVPKPINAHIDKWFEPSKKDMLAFEKHIGDKQIQKEAASPHFLLASFAPLAASVYLNLSRVNNTLNLSKQEIEKLVIQWLESQSVEHPLFTSTKQSPVISMQNFVKMATGNAAISLDFCIGQVWRHCQPIIYKALSHNECSNEVFTKIIELDESTKRYSYGPPVESIQQLLALNKLGILNLNFVNNPNINLTNNGWKFDKLGKSITTTLMVDSVLDSPKIKAVKSNIIQQMLDDKLINVVHDELGVKTNESGYLISSIQKQHIPIALLGRLAKGTVIGVDAILECFGSRPKQWAKQAAINHLAWLNKI